MSCVERNQFGYPIFEATWPEFDRRRIREFLERVFRQPAPCPSVVEDQLVEWTHLWVDVGGEG